LTRWRTCCPPQPTKLALFIANSPDQHAARDQGVQALNALIDGLRASTSRPSTIEELSPNVTAAPLTCVASSPLRPCSPREPVHCLDHCIGGAAQIHPRVADAG
jgi:hypothetical protein